VNLINQPIYEKHKKVERDNWGVMIKKEIQNKISKFDDNFKVQIENYRITLNFIHVNDGKFTLGFYDLLEFIEKQHFGWLALASVNDIVEFKNSIAFFNSLYSSQESIISNLTNDNYKSSLFDLSKLFPSEILVFTYNSREVNFFLDLYKLNKKAVTFAYNFLFSATRTPLNWTRDSNAVFGIISAINFKGELSNLLFNDNEKNRNEIFTLINKSKIELSELEKLKSEFTLILTISENQTNNRKKVFDEQSEKFETIFHNNQEKIEKTQKDKFIEIQEAYRDKLMLEEPVKHWETRAKDLLKQANNWIAATIASTFIGLLLFVNLLYSLSYKNIQEQIKNPAISIRWSIISLFSVAIVVFLIRTFTKLAMSNYHLYRDAQERKHLTYLYLSLKTQGDIPDADRQIILQSLFSRADTGLLKEDSGPTMPVSVLDKLK
jgi:hypothetical protein